MIYNKRLGVLVCTSTFLLILCVFWTSKSGFYRGSLGRASQLLGLGEYYQYQDDDGSDNATEAGSLSHQYGQAQPEQNSTVPSPSSHIFGGPFEPGIPNPRGENYTRSLIIAKTKNANYTEWIYKADLGGDIRRMVYVVDDPKADLKVPKNKGHEVMVYLTYIIDHYQNLSDINIFMHSHQWAWHNNEILNTDSVELVRRLNGDRVRRDGYMNLRCYWGPGCPAWLRPATVEENHKKQEESKMARAWSEIFPDWDVPVIISSTCCAQFAISRERIQMIPRQRFIDFRNWLLTTSLPDKISGRIWEYLWHVVFTGQAVYCPSQWECYCDGYGVCFEDEDELMKWYQYAYDYWETKSELDRWREQEKKLKKERLKAGGENLESANLDVPVVNQDVEHKLKMDWLAGVMHDMKHKAIERGDRRRLEQKSLETRS